jgi:uncharacterized alpha-E superfamily protein
VDVILRRLDDDFCDPLELRGDSSLGVPGLVQSVLAGNVAVANALGSSLVESPALFAYLPALCRELLGEDLKLPSIPTWWCGDPVARRHVLANLRRMVVRPAFPGRRFEPRFGDRLTAAEREKLAARIAAQPGDFVAEQPVSLSTVPVLVDGDLEPRRAVVRLYLTAKDAGYTAMPGGLTRVAASAQDLEVSMQAGGGSRDTWVLNDGPVGTFSLLPTSAHPVELSRGGGDLPGRTADNLYWLGRHVERAEGQVRLLRGILLRMTERAGWADAPELTSLLQALGHLTQTDPGLLRLAAPSGDLLAVIVDARRAGGLGATLDNLHEAARLVRDRLSQDMWRTLRRLEIVGPEPSGGGAHSALSDRLEWLDLAVSLLAAFSGLVSESLTRGPGWQFLDLGRRLERSLQTAGLIRIALVPVGRQEGPLLEALLDIADSTMTYHRRYLSSVQVAPVLDLLLADESNPRALAVQLVALNAGLDELVRIPTLTSRSPERRLALALLTELRLADPEALAQPGSTGGRAALDALLDRFESDLPRLSDAIARGYLSHLQASRQLGHAPGGLVP